MSGPSPQDQHLLPPDDDGTATNPDQPTTQSPVQESNDDGAQDAPAPTAAPAAAQVEAVPAPAEPSDQQPEPVPPVGHRRRPSTGHGHTDAATDAATDTDAKATATAAGASAAVAAVLLGTEKGDEAPAEPEPVEPPEDPDLRAIRGKVADRSALAMMLSLVPVIGIIGFAILLTLTTSWMRGSAATGFELTGRGANYQQALDLSWSVLLNTLPAILDGAAAAVLASLVLQWVESVPLARRRWRWAAAFFPLLVSMPVRAAGMARFLGPGQLLPEDVWTTGLLTNVVWVSAAIPMAILIMGIAMRWVNRKAALALAAALCSSWLALDIAAPGLFARLVPVSTLGPVIDTLMSLAGQLQLSAALVVMSVGVLGGLLGLAGWYAMRRGMPPERGPAHPVGVGGAALAIGSLAITYFPIIVTLGVGLAEGGRPWRLCAPPSGCAPILTTALLLVPTTLAAGFLAACAYYAGWLNPIYRRPGALVGMVSGFILPPTALGLALWLTAVYFRIPRGLLTLFIGQTLVATGLAFCAVHVSQLRTKPYVLAVGNSYAVPKQLYRAGLYAGALGALYASSDFALANQLSGSVVTVPTSAFAESITLGTVGDEVLASLIWSLLIVPLFLVCLDRILAMASHKQMDPPAADQQSPAELAGV